MSLALHLLASFGPLLSFAKLEQIIEADYLRNHSNRDYSVERVKELMLLWRAEGRHIYSTGLIAFVLQEQAPKVLEFHSINGGSAKDLSAAVNEMLTNAAPHYDTAVTYYDNPRVSDLLKHSAFPVTCTRIDGGEDRTFEAKFDLRS